MIMVISSVTFIRSRPNRYPWLKGLSKIAGICLFLYLTTLILFVTIKSQFIFPGSQPDDQGNVLDVSPEACDVNISVDARTYVHAWWVPASAQNAPTILFFYGFDGVLGSRAERALLELRHSNRDLLSIANVLLVDYRGYGSSSPLKASAASTREDALAAFHYLQLARGIPAKNIVISGWSLGTGVATQLAEDEPEAKALILISPITSVNDVANTTSWIFRIPLRPAQWIRHGNDFANVDKIASLRMPLMIIVGSDDHVSPPWMAHQLFALAQGRKTVFLVRGAGHGNAITKDPQFSTNILSRFLQSISRR